VLNNKNEIGMELSEIEGDALLFLPKRGSSYDGTTDQSGAKNVH